jgi:c-di-AMP phosphodiesterase-like protein
MSEYYQTLENIKAFPNSEIITEIFDFIIQQEKINNHLKAQLVIATGLLDENNIKHNINVGEP